MQQQKQNGNDKPSIGASVLETVNHPADCKCIDCQIVTLVGVISGCDLPELLPILRTLQFVRDNQEQIRKLKR